MAAVRPIETRYAGCRFRSRLEARWAVFLDTVGVRWEYEAEGYDTPAGPYLPDFLLYLREPTLFEIKPESDLGACRRALAAGATPARRRLWHAAPRPARSVPTARRWPPEPVPRRVGQLLRLLCLPVVQRGRHRVHGPRRPGVRVRPPHRRRGSGTAQTASSPRTRTRSTATTTRTSSPATTRRSCPVRARRDPAQRLRRGSGHRPDGTRMAGPSGGASDRVGAVFPTSGLSPRPGRRRRRHRRTQGVLGAHQGGVAVDRVRPQRPGPSDGAAVVGRVRRLRRLPDPPRRTAGG